MVPLTGQNTVNDMVDRINEVSQEIQDVAFVNANVVMGPASSVVDQIMAFSDTTGKKAKAANISSFAYSILDDADDAAVRATLGLKSAAVLDAATAATANTVVQRDASGNITGVGITTTSGFVGNGSQITSLNMGNVASGTLAVANGGTGTTTSTGTGSVVRSASPTFTGAPLSTTASADTNTTQIATTAFVIGQASSTSPVMNGAATVGTSLRYARADHVHPSDTSKVNTSLLGVANGVATLDSAGKVPTSQLPAYVDDVLEYANLASFPATGETGKIYVALNTNKTYRWSGSAYIYITSSAVDSVAGKTGVVSLVKGDVELGDVDNTSDVNKPVSTAQQNALNLKANIASPALTGTPTAPTAAVGTNTAQLATTAFVNAEIANNAPSKTGSGASGTWGINITGSAGSAGSANTANTLAGNETDWATQRTSAVANMLGWKKYGNGHVIFDASAGTAPNGVAKNSVTPEQDWVVGNPTLMGWNGTNTYGVQVARAAQAEKCVDTGWILLSLYNNFAHTGDALHIRRVGNIVYLQGQMLRLTPPDGYMGFTNIPAGFRPVKSTFFTTNMFAANFELKIGTMSVEASNGYAAIGLIGLPSQYNANWLINTCWVTDYA